MVLTVLRSTLVLLFVAASAAAQTTLKFATLAPEGSAWMRAFDRVRRAVQEVTAGQVAIKVYPAGILGEEKDVLFKIRTGQVDGGAFMGFGVGRICPDASALMQPLVFRDYDEVDAVFPRLAPLLEAQALSNGFVTLGWAEVGFSYLFSTRSVQTLADLRASKPWIMPGEESITELFSVARVNGIPITVSDVLPALQSGLIHTVYGPPTAVVAMQWHTRVRYRNELRLLYSFGGVFVAERAWNKVPAAHRTAILDIFRRETQTLTQEIRRSDEEALRAMSEHQIRVVTAPPEAVEELRQFAAQSFERLKGRLFSARIAQELQAALDEVRKRAGPTDEKS